FQLGPDPGDDRHALAVREPLEGFDAGGHVANAARLAAIGRYHVELRLLVLLAFLLALGDEADQVAARREAGLAVLVAAMRQRARTAAERGEQPQRGVALVLRHVVAAERADG